MSSHFIKQIESKNWCESSIDEVSVKRIDKGNKGLRVRNDAMREIQPRMQSI